MSTKTTISWFSLWLLSIYCHHLKNGGSFSSIGFSGLLFRSSPFLFIGRSGPSLGLKPTWQNRGQDGRKNQSTGMEANETEYICRPIYFAQCFYRGRELPDIVWRGRKEDYHGFECLSRGFIQEGRQCKYCYVRANGKLKPLVKRKYYPPKHTPLKIICKGES